MFSKQTRGKLFVSLQTKDERKGPLQLHTSLFQLFSNRVGFIDVLLLWTQPKVLTKGMNLASLGLKASVKRVRDSI